MHFFTQSSSSFCSTSWLHGCLSVCLSVCVARLQPWTMQKRQNRCRLGRGNSHGPMQGSKYLIGCTLASPSKYDWSICATASMRTLAPITVATCSVTHRIRIFSNPARGFSSMPIHTRSGIVRLAGVGLQFQCKTPYYFVWSCNLQSCISRSRIFSVLIDCLHRRKNGRRCQWLL